MGEQMRKDNVAPPFLLLIYLAFSSLSFAAPGTPQAPIAEGPIFMVSESKMKATTISGLIREVMESYPLQLSVDVREATYSVALLEDTKVMRAGREIDSGALKPGLQVTVTGQPSAESEFAMTAERIEVH